MIQTGKACSLAVAAARVMCTQAKPWCSKRECMAAAKPLRRQIAHLADVMPCACTWKLVFPFKINGCTEHCSIELVLLSGCRCTMFQYTSLQNYHHCARRTCSLQGQRCGPLTTFSNLGADEEAVQKATQDIAANWQSLSVAHPLNQVQFRSASSRAVLTRERQQPTQTYKAQQSFDPRQEHAGFRYS